MTIGLICEYNPFHNGHLHHINEIKKMYPNSTLILVISGYFTQRGEVSILSKEDKTKISLKYGIDIVLELPVLYSTQSADTFAYRSIEILNHFKIDKLIFGSESNNIDSLSKIADIQLNSKTFNDDVRELLKSGINYPTALSRALNQDIEYTPNDLLGISYIKAIKRINNNIIPESIKRTNSYHDIESNDFIVSASNIRNKIVNNEDIINYIPNYDINLIREIDYQLLFNLLKLKIITDCELDSYLTVDEGIENRLVKVVCEVNSVKELISEVKTKRYTYNKISRMLIHILLGIKKKDALNNLSYIKILGFTNKGKEYLNVIKKDIDIPLTIVKDSYQYQLEIVSSIIYDLLTNSNSKNFENSNKPVINQ